MTVNYRGSTTNVRKVQYLFHLEIVIDATRLLVEIRSDQS